MSLAQELRERGLVAHHSGTTLEEITDAHRRTVYLGIDPTADSLHVGHLVPYLLLNHFLAHGHQVVVLIGGATAQIGDPSGRDTERALQTSAVIQENAATLEEKIRALTTHSDRIQFLNNYNWFEHFSVLQFLREVGKHFTVNAMLKKESVQRRLESEQGISFTEFSYALLQSYDFYHLHQTCGCDVQIGATDQWGNISAGIDFIRRKTGAEVHGITLPLMVNPLTGRKFGKSETGTVWLDKEKTSPFHFHQFWLQTPDEVVGQYLRVFTLLPLTEITRIESAHTQDPSARVAQRALAHAVTTFVHGEEAAHTAQAAADFLFYGSDLATLDAATLQMLQHAAPTKKVSANERVIDVLVSLGLVESKREARQHINQGAVTVSGSVVSDHNDTLGQFSFTNGAAVVRLGKHRVAFVTTT